MRGAPIGRLAFEEVVAGLGEGLGGFVDEGSLSGRHVLLDDRQHLTIHVRGFRLLGGIHGTGQFLAGVHAGLVGLDRLGVNGGESVREQDGAAKERDALGGTIDVLVNVAGVVGQGPVEELTEEAWDHVFAVNCKGTFLMTREVVPLMKERGRGKIVNFSSKSGKTGSALMSHYSAAKGAIIGFTQALAYELADAGINVNCVCPGITEDTGVWSSVSAGYTQTLGLSREQVVKKFTDKIPLKRLATIGDIVAVTLFLASSAADYMTGQAINVTGGREMH